jgi:calmodulin
MITDGEHEQIGQWVEAALHDPRNLATEQELLTQATAAFQAFRKADRTNSNTLSIPELLRLCDEMGLPADKAEEGMLMKIDGDDSGELPIHEWVVFWLKRVSTLPNPAKQQEAIARNTFKKFDKDGSGNLDVDELRALVVSLGARFTDQEMDEAMRELDADGSGEVDEQEFVSWWVNRTLNARAGGGLIAMKLKKLARKAAQTFFTDIFTAVWKNDVDMVTTFVESDPRVAVAVDTNDYGDGWTPLHYACYQGHGEIVDILLAAGAAVNGTNDLGFTPLFYAAQNNHLHICKLLVEQGADPAASGASPDDPDQFMCPVDHVVDSPELMKLFRTHPKCQPPEAPPADRTAASLSDAGVLVVDLPPTKLFTTLPVRQWHLLLSASPAATARSPDAVMELLVPGVNPNTGQTRRVGETSLQLKVLLDKRALRTKFGELTATPLYLKAAALNSFED